MLIHVSVYSVLPPPEEYKPKSLASRLSDKIQTSLTSEDDDFQPDRKRIRTPAMEQKVGHLIELYVFLWVAILTIRLIIMICPCFKFQGIQNLHVCGFSVLCCLECLKKYLTSQELLEQDIKIL